MNAVDHAHGGGRGKSKGNKHPRSIYGTLQHVRTRRPKDKDGNRAYVYSFLFWEGARHTDANICIVQCCYRTTKRKADSGQALDTHFFLSFRCICHLFTGHMACFFLQMRKMECKYYHDSLSIYMSTSNNYRLSVAFFSMADPSLGLWRYLRPADTRGSDCKFESFLALVISASSH